MKQLLILILTGFIATTMVAANLEAPGEKNCGKFADSPKGEEGLKFHSLYRDYIKNDNYEKAFPLWEQAYNIAPAADGKRATHYSDGIILYKNMLENTTDDTKKEEYKKTVLRLYTERIECYDEEGYVLGRKVYDMYYHLQSPKEDIYKDAKRSVELEDLKTEYIVLTPYTQSAVDLYKEGKITADEAREIHKKLMEIADHNISTSKLKEQYKTVKAQVELKFNEVSRDANGIKGLFDCSYFVKQQRPVYQTNPDDITNLEAIVGKLTAGGCSESDAFYNEVWGKVKNMRRTQLDEERRVRDSIAVANRTDKDWGWIETKNKNYDKALMHFVKALDKETLTNDEKANIYYTMAKIFYGEKGQKSNARGFARQAAGFRSGWADPYVLIGEMYASSGKDCGSGTGFDSQRTVWPAIDQWEKAIRVEPGSDGAARAQKLINNYTQYMPSGEQVFMRGMNKGQSYTVPCWINETTTIRFVK